MKRLRISDLRPSESHLMPDLFGGRGVDHGGIHVFQPGEIAHPEPIHIHDSEEVFVILQGQGIIPIDGVEHAVRTGDVVIVDPGEDHHTRSSMDDPLVTAWYMVAKPKQA